MKDVLRFAARFSQEIKINLMACKLGISLTTLLDATVFSPVFVFFPFVLNYISF